MKENPRRQILFCVFIFLFVLSSSSQNFIPKTIIGKWDGIDSTNKIGSVEFLDSSKLKLTIPDQGNFICQYSFDTVKNPIWFDIILESGEQKLILKGLVKFIDENTLKWQVSLNGERLNSFQKETSDNTIILVRGKGQK